MSLDLATLDLTTEQSEGAWLTLRHPKTGEDLPLRIKLAGAESKAYKTIEQQWTNRAIEQQQRAGRVKPLKAEELEQRAHRLLAAVTMEWESEGEPYLMLDGQRYVCNAENARLIYSKRQWIADQADEFIRDPVNFGQEGEKKASIFDAEAAFHEIPGNSLSGPNGALVSLAKMETDGPR